MEHSAIDIYRRAFVVKMFAGVVMGLTGLPGTVRTASSWWIFSKPQGMRKIQGEVKINGIPAVVDAPVQPGDVVTTGPDSSAVFVIGKSVYLLRDNTRVDLSEETSDNNKKIVKLLRMITGKMLSVYGRSRRKIVTQTAVIGIRGTGIYVESEPERTYVCTCYGIADIEAKSEPSVRETVKTEHHEAPRYVYRPGEKQLIVEAPVKNHTDKELIMLEEMAWRLPPFVKNDTTGFGGY